MVGLTRNGVGAVLVVFAATLMASPGEAQEGEESAPVETATPTPTPPEEPEEEGEPAATEAATPTPAPTPEVMPPANGTAAGGVPATAPAAAKPKERRFGDVNTMEVGGTIELQGGRIAYDDFGGNTSRSIEFSPRVGAFVARNFQLFGQLSFGSELTEYDSGARESRGFFGIGGGAGYYFDLGGALVGPQAGIDFRSVRSSEKDVDGNELEVDITGALAGMALVAKVPIPRGGGLLTTGFYFNAASINVEASSGALSVEDDGTQTFYGTRVGYSIWF